MGTYINIGDLFVTIGLKDGDKTAKGLASVSKGMNTFASDTLAAKAAVVGVIYALERMTSSIGDKAIGWQQMAATSNVDMQFMQKWDRAAQVNKVSADQMTGSIYGVAKALTKMRIDGTAIDALGPLQQYTKGPLDLTRAYKDTAYFWDKIVEFSQNKALDASTKSHFMDMMGVERNVQALIMSRGSKDTAIPKNKWFSDTDLNKAAAMGRELNHVLVDAGITLQKLAVAFGPGAVKEFAHAFSAVDKALASMEKYIGKDGTLYVGLSALALAVTAAFGPLGVALTAMGVLIAEYDKIGTKDESMVSKAAGYVAGYLVKVATPPNEVQRNLRDVSAEIAAKQKQRQEASKKNFVTVNQGDVNITGVAGVEDAKEHFTEQMNKAANIYVNQIYARPK